MSEIKIISPIKTFSHLFLFILSNCIYQNDGENFNHISSDNKENVTISFDFNTENDSIFLSENSVFTINIIDRKIYQLQVLIDGVRISSSFNYNLITFELNPEDFSEGRHELSIDVIVSSETNSIADKLKSEAVNIYKVFNLYIDKTPPKSIESLTVENDAGALMLRWSLPEKQNFSRYKIIKNILDTLENTVLQEIIIIEDINTLSYHDKYYTGGPVTYQIDIESGTFYVPGSQNKYNEEVMNIEFYFNEENKIISEWCKSTLPKNKLRYALFEDNIFQGYLKEDNDSKIRSTSSESLPFMQEKLMELRIYPDNASLSDYKYYNSIKRTELFIGKKIKEYDEVLFLKDQNIILTFKNDFDNGSTLRIYDSENMIKLNERISSRGSHFYASENGEYIYERYGSKELYQIDLLSLERVSKIDLEMLLNQSVNRLKRISISNNNIVSLEINDNPYVINFNTLSIIWNLSQAYTHTPVISPNSKYFFYFSSMYEISGDNATKIYDMPSYSVWSQIFFGASDDEQFYSLIRSNNHVLVYGHSSGALINTFTYSGDLFVGQFGIDKETGHIFKTRYVSGSTFIIELFDKNNFDILKTQKIDVSNNSNTGYKILNNKVFSTDGRFLELN